METSAFLSAIFISLGSDFVAILADEGAEYCNYSINVILSTFICSLSHKIWPQKMKIALRKALILTRINWQKMGKSPD